MSDTFSLRKSWIILLGLAVSGVALYGALRGVAWRDVLQTFVNINPVTASICAFFVALGIFCRGLRWWVVCRDAPAGPLDFGRAALFGVCANQILPGRIGELVKIYLLNRWARISVPLALGSAVLDRGCDALVLMLSAVALSGFLDLQDLDWISRAGQYLVLLVAVGAVFIALSGQVSKVLDHWTRRAASPWSLKPAVFLAVLVDLFRRQLYLSQVLRLVLCGLLVLVTDYAAVALAMASAGLTLPVEVPLLLWVALASSAMVPAGPAHLGVYQWAAVWSLGLYHVERHEAVAVAFILQALLLCVSLGGTLLVLSVKRGFLLGRMTEDPKPREH